jgi:hypothetical protein
MPTPSLILVPARFKTGKLYTPVATTSGGVVLGASGDFNVTRATTATRFNSAGLIESVASGVPRLDYYTSGGTAGCPALLVEPAATNLFSGSADLGSTTYWSRPAGANVTGNVSGIIAPDGTQTATLFQASGTTTTNSRLRQTWSRTTTGAHAMSVFVRGFSGVAASGAVVCGVGASELNFAITSGGVVTLTSMTGGAAAVTSGIVNYGNGWYRLTAVGTAATSGSTNSELYCLPSGGPQYYAWGAQVEAGSVATSYIPTTTAAVTRNADVINLSGAVSGCIGQTEGTMYLDFIFRRPTIATAGPCGIASSNNQNRVLFWNNNSTNSMAVNIQVNAANIFNISVGTLIEGTRYKLAIGYKSGNSAIFLNGIQVGSTNTSAFTFAASLVAIFLGTYEAAAASVTNTGINAFTLYTTRLTNTELAALTA